MYIRSTTLSALVALYASLASATSHLGENARPSAAVAGAGAVGGGQAQGVQAAGAAGAAPVVSINTGPAPANGGAAAAQATGIGMNGGAQAVSGTTTVHVVKVGGAGGALVFEPNNLRANPGDMVQFQFNPKNHSVAMSTFDQPCLPIQQTKPEAPNAFWSGFMPTDRQGMLTYTISVTDTKPLWYYCAQGKHCQQGMVGVINEPQNSPNTLQAYAAKAAAAAENIAPNGSGSGAGVIGGAGSLGTTLLGPTATLGVGVGATAGVGGIGASGIGGGVISPSGIETGGIAQQTVNAARGLEVGGGVGWSAVAVVMAAVAAW